MNMALGIFRQGDCIGPGILAQPDQDVSRLFVECFPQRRILLNRLLERQVAEILQQKKAVAFIRLVNLRAATLIERRY